MSAVKKMSWHLVLAAALVSLTSAAPQCRPRYTNSSLYAAGGITILTQNLLDGTPNTNTSATLLSQPSSFSTASSSCALLGESLWNPAIQDFHASLNSSLAYQVFRGLATNSSLYWVNSSPTNFTSSPSSSSNSSSPPILCPAINPAGELFAIPCSLSLPTLCTNSAPVSTGNVGDTSARWRFEQKVGGVRVTGYRDLHVFKFRGLRYAETPERFRYAVTKSWDQGGDVEALTAGADCTQPIGEVRSGSSEDCLFANVWSPSLPSTTNGTTGKKGELKPVMVYLYGGGFTSGSGKNPNTDGTNLASRGDVVVVSINYRVGSLGFLAFDDGVHNGNYGISDMVAALEWVRDYIGYFGGNKDRVTVFGESAGAMATHILLQSPRAKGLFRRAIMQSDPSGYPRDERFTWSQYNTPAQEYRDTTSKVLRESGCANATDQVACVKAIGGFDLVNLGTNANGATADGVYLTHHELDLTRPGYAADVDVMTGVNRDEAGVLIDNYPANGTNFTSYFADNVGNHISLPPSTASSFQLSALGTSFGAILTPEQIFNASLRIATDGEFTCFELAKAYAGAKNMAFRNTYAFEFNRTYSPSGYTKPWCDAPKTSARPNGDPDREYYKCHAGEQLLVFGNVRRAGQPDRDGLDVPFTQLVVDYWAAFARTGDPNPEREYLEARGYWSTLERVEQTGRWEQVDPDMPGVRLLQWDGKMVPFVEGAQCEALGLPLDMLAVARD